MQIQLFKEDFPIKHLIPFEKYRFSPSSECELTPHAYKVLFLYFHTRHFAQTHPIHVIKHLAPKLAMKNIAQANNNRCWFGRDLIQGSAISGLHSFRF